MLEQHKMGFLILSEGGDGLGLAIRLQEEGHDTAIYIKDPVAEQRGEGLCDKDSSPDFVPTYIGDCTGSGVILDNYKDNGGRTFGGSKIADRLESDRKFANEVFKKCGIQQPESKEFHDWDSAKEFVESVENKLVFKPEGKFSGVLPSHVPHDNEELLEMFEQWKGVIGNEPEFILQEFIEGTCISSEAWVAKGKLLFPFNHTLERKQFMDGDLGPSGGCTGNVVWVCTEESCDLCANLHALEAFLSEHEYSGPIDINSVVSKEGDIYALEFTPRFGYDAFPTFLYGLFDGDFGGFINDCCRGSGYGDLPLLSGFAAGVRVSLPPWPSEDFHAKAGIPIRGLRQSNLEQFYCYEVSKQKESFVTSGGWGIIGVAIGHGETIEEAFEEAYRFCKKLRLPDAQYRTDLAEVFKKDYNSIERLLSVNV